MDTKSLTRLAFLAQSDLNSYARRALYSGKMLLDYPYSEKLQTAHQENVKRLSEAVIEMSDLVQRLGLLDPDSLLENRAIMPELLDPKDNPKRRKSAAQALQERMQEDNR